MDGLRTGDGPPPSDTGRLRSPRQRSRVFWNTEPLLRNGERKVSDEFSLRPTRDPSARRRKLTPDAKHPSGHPRLRRPKGALCFTRRPPRIRKSVRSSNGDCPRALSRPRLGRISFTLLVASKDNYLLIILPCRQNAASNHDLILRFSHINEFQLDVKLPQE